MTRDHVNVGGASRPEHDLSARDRRVVLRLVERGVVTPDQYSAMTHTPQGRGRGSVLAARAGYSGAWLACTSLLALPALILCVPALPGAPAQVTVGVMLLTVAVVVQALALVVVGHRDWPSVLAGARLAATWHPIWAHVAGPSRARTRGRVTTRQTA